MKYGLPSPLSLLLQGEPLSKQAWNNLVKTRVTVWHEQNLRKLSLSNSKMAYFNVQLAGLSGRPHPILHNIFTTLDAKKLRLHIKFLTCDFNTNERLAAGRPEKSPACSLCLAPLDSIEHVLVSCRSTSEIRSRLYPELVNTVVDVQPMCAILSQQPSPQVLTQFILDCTSINLPHSYRIPSHNPGVANICKVSMLFSVKGLVC